MSTMHEVRRMWAERERRMNWAADWRVSRKGNHWRVMRKHCCTIFVDKKTGMYKLVLSYPDDSKSALFSPPHATLDDAKRAGHRALLSAAYPEQNVA